MSCSICGRGGCTRSFHSIEEQDLFDELESMDECGLKREVAHLRSEVEDRDAEIKKLETYIEKLEDQIP